MSTPCQIPGCPRVFLSRETNKDITEHFKQYHPLPKNTMFSCYCKSCRKLLGTHLKMEEGHYCKDCQGLKHIDPDPVEQLASTVHDMVQAEKLKAKQLPFTKEQLLIRLHQLAESKDSEEAHGVADEQLIRYINDREIEIAYTNIKKWYA